jgi:hypothetical protein
VLYHYLKQINKYNLVLQSYSLPKTLSTFTTNPGASLFLLLNNEFRNDTILSGFQLIGASNGTITIQVLKIFFKHNQINKFELKSASILITFFLMIKVVNSTLCGSTVSCAAYYSLYPFNNAPATYADYSWTFNIIVGFNILPLSTPVSVFKGSFIMLTQTALGKVAIDTSGIASYSDMILGNAGSYYNLSYSTTGIPMPSNNYRFYLSTLISLTSYQKSFNMVHTYLTAGIYSASITFLNAQAVYNLMVTITQSKKIIHFD